MSGLKYTPPTRSLPTKSSIIKNKYGTQEEFQKQRGLDTTFRGADMRSDRHRCFVEDGQGGVEAVGRGADSKAQGRIRTLRCVSVTGILVRQVLMMFLYFSLR